MAFGKKCTFHAKIFWTGKVLQPHAGGIGVADDGPGIPRGGNGGPVRLAYRAFDERDAAKMQGKGVGKQAGVHLPGRVEQVSPAG